MNRLWKQKLSVVLSVAMLFSMTGINNTVFAARDIATLGLPSLCGHHESHSSDCYTGEQICGCAVDSGEDIATESDTQHVHTQDCYKLDCRFTCDVCGQQGGEPAGGMQILSRSGDAAFETGDTFDLTRISTLGASGGSGATPWT